jgi:hypothetical protein
MPTRTITATALARNFSDLLNQVRYQGVTLDVRRGKELIARVTPPANIAGFPIDQLDALLSAAPALSDAVSGEFLRDIHEATGGLVTEDSAWGS